MLSHYSITPHGTGDKIKNICPFHNDHKPSCGVNLEKQVYNCFACDAGGNALDFFAHMEGLDPSNASELRKAPLAAAEMFGIDQALERPANE
ncbi:CHC2 zinc finger domain-containing protein [Robiginitomaculum antarcticum]|uniref:CHC2 zinc finger domain-containing protein n=1 Tax=Robiginitomaculum antarcticum TaxID=437507 RepID=UPI00037298FF|nr:CHC2 zinc finger domain-containing protein [Robiginitomaculum antarcticum]